MSDSDALVWTIEKDPLLRSTITAVSLLDSLAPPRWEVDPNFDLERDPGDPGPMPEPPGVQVLGPLERLADGAAHVGREVIAVG